LANNASPRHKYHFYLSDKAVIECTVNERELEDDDPCVYVGYATTNTKDLERLMELLQAAADAVVVQMWIKAGSPLEDKPKGDPNLN
jgi:hypothetical protein